MEGSTVAKIIAALDIRYKGLAAYQVDQRGALREHVNVFVDNELVADHVTLTDPG